jgi:hypothetical protein
LGLSHVVWSCRLCRVTLLCGSFPPVHARGVREAACDPKPTPTHPQRGGRWLQNRTLILNRCSGCWGGGMVVAGR